MTIDNHEEFVEECKTAIESLCEIAEYTDDGEAEHNFGELQWLAVVKMSFYKALGSDSSNEDSSDFRVDGDVY